MVKEIALPEISENVQSGTVVTVHISEGDRVDKDDPLFEIETEKAAVDVPAEEAGTVKEVRISEGEEIKVGDVICTIETEDDTKEAEDSRETEKEAAEDKEDKEDKEYDHEATGKKDQEKSGTASRQKREEEAQEEQKTKASHKEMEAEESSPREKESKDLQKMSQAPASPSTRRLARELGVDISRINGSGPGGRISDDDVKRSVKQGEASGGRERMEETELPDFSKWGPVHYSEQNKVRQITAQTMSRAVRTIPHVHQFDDADIGGAEHFIAENERTVEKSGGKLTLTAVLLKICARALKNHPRFNSSYDGANNRIIIKDYIHIGLAVDTDRGLLVPVIRDVDKKGIFDIALEIADLAERTRNKKVKPDEMEGGTFSVSNLGSIGGTNFTPIIYPPQAAILGISRAVMKQRYTGEGFEARKILPLALAYDHRIVDGADGARFLRWIVDALESPLSMDFYGDKDE
jgi:pyruvate dehydrogenase E2 component (dihydrolipoamide acetyltransferase)